MKIAVSLEDGHVGKHFGHCPSFALYEVDAAGKASVAKTLHQAPPHEPGRLPRWLHELGAGVVITGGMGAHAQELLAGLGVRIILGAPADDPDHVVASFLDGTLKSEANLCDH